MAIVKTTFEPMNELEKEIEKSLDEAYKNAGQNAYFGSGFIAGCNFILEKNLDEQFAEWIVENFYKTPSGWNLKNYNTVTGVMFERDGEPIYYATKYLKDYWLNNVYGK